MEGPALAWFQWMMCNHQFPTWAGFLQAIETRFAHSPYEDPTGILFKLTQTGSVSEYLHQFKALANRIVGLPPSLLLSCFVSGLNPDIRCEVQVLQPLTLVQAVGLARLQEDKLAEQRRPYRSRATPGPTPPTPSLFPTLPSPTPPLLPSPAKPPPLPWKRLTPAEIASHRERSLCFNCDERYTQGHHCASRFFLLIVEDDKLEEPSDPNITNPDPCLEDLNQQDLPQAQISFCALLGHSDTLRLLGRIANQPSSSSSTAAARTTSCRLG